jgi:hypothetical protein
MHDRKPLEITELSKEELLALTGMLMGDVLVHYGMWFTETVRRLGLKTALEADREVLRRYYPLVVQRLAPHFGIHMTEGTPTSLLTKSREELLLLIGDIAKTWVASDGLWFQAVEAGLGMDPAKMVNDACWSHFARMEAFKIKELLDLGDSGGLVALEQALKLRIYSTINAHSVTWDPDGSLIFEMTECRVQTSRRGKAMQDYPCKSAGLVEYTEFAHEIDPRIKTECVWCPPDRVPDKEFCAWRFRME